VWCAAVIGVLVAQLREKGVVPIEIEETQETEGAQERLRRKFKEGALDET